MIVELVGLPGSGKTTIAEAMRARGVVSVSIPSRTQLLCGAVAFWSLRPVLALNLVWHIMTRAPQEVRYELFVNGYLGYAARYRKARLLSRMGAPVVLDQGFFQLFISLEDLSAAFSEAFPKPDFLVAVEAPTSVREERMARRGWAPRGESGLEKRLMWERNAEKAYRDMLPALERSVRVYRYDGSQNPQKGVEAFMAFARQHSAMVPGSALRNALKLFVAGISFIIAQFVQFFIGTPQVVVLMYHAIDRSGWKLSVTPETFERQMRFLARKGWAVPLADVVAYAKGDKRLPAHAVTITFDDGYRDLLTTVLPIMERYHIPATVFIPSDLSASADPGGTPRLTREELRSLTRSPLITVGSHAETHRKFTELSPEEMRNEAERSADALARVTGKRPRSFAYPFGARSMGAEHVVKDAGYEAAFGITEGCIQQGDNLFSLKRVQIDGTMSFSLFRLRLTSAVDWNRRIVNLLRRAS